RADARADDGLHEPSRRLRGVRPRARCDTIPLTVPRLRTFKSVGNELRQDLVAAQERDPAARDLGRWEILLTYPGVHALLTHRVAHRLHQAGVPILPRMLAYFARMATNIEIHPAAKIGEALFI